MNVGWNSSAKRWNFKDLIKCPTVFTKSQSTLQVSPRDTLFMLVYPCFIIPNEFWWNLWFFFTNFLKKIRLRSVTAVGLNTNILWFITIFLRYRQYGSLHDWFLGKVGSTWKTRRMVGSEEKVVCSKSSRCSRPEVPGQDEVGVVDKQWWNGRVSIKNLTQ